MKNIILTLVLTSAFNMSLKAQILGSIMDRATRKVENRLADKLVEVISDELARRAFQPIENSIDSINRANYEKENGGKVDWDKAGSAYADFLNGLNKQVDLPNSYIFEMTQEVEVIDYNGDKSYNRLHYSQNGNYFGMEQLNDDKNNQVVVMDLERDAMILFTTDKNGKKTGQTVPSVMKFASAMTSSATNDEAKTSITKTGKTKKIAGYNADEYTVITAEETGTMYSSINLPVKWSESFTNYFSKIAPKSYSENKALGANGILMEYTNIPKEESAKKTSWKTKKISDKEVEIKTSEYEFTKITTETNKD